MLLLFLRFSVSVSPWLMLALNLSWPSSRKNFSVLSKPIPNLFTSVTRIWLIPFWMATWPWIPSSMTIRARGSWLTWEGSRSRSCRRWWWRASGSLRCLSLPPELRTCQQLPPSFRIAATALPLSHSPEGNPHSLQPSQPQFSIQLQLPFPNHLPSTQHRRTHQFLPEQASRSPTSHLATPPTSYLSTPQLCRRGLHPGLPHSLASSCSKPQWLPGLRMRCVTWTFHHWGSSGNYLIVLFVFLDQDQSQPGKTDLRWRVWLHSAEADFP